MADTFKSVSTRPQAVKPAVRKTVSRFNSRQKDIKTFVDLFGAVMRQTSAPHCAQDKYLTYIEKQLLFRGSGFLKQCRAYPVFGLRILGRDIGNERPTEVMFDNVKLRPNADGVLLPHFLSWYWNRLYILSSIEYPNKVHALEVSRILAVLSFSKFYLIDSKRGRRSAEISYNHRVRNVTGKLPMDGWYEANDTLYDEMVSFVNLYGNTKAGKEFEFDRRCYSLKCLVNKKRHRPRVPKIWGYQSVTNALGIFNFDGSFGPNRLVDTVQPYYYSTEPFDAKMCVIAESGGKFRGICPYSSPYAHCIDLYKNCRDLLLKFPGNSNYDQAIGQRLAQSLSKKNLSIVSADASDFSDTINVKYAAMMARALGSDGAVHYCSYMHVKDCDGEIITGCAPLMGFKGTFDLASVLLAFSFHKHLGGLNPKRAQCGDDYIGNSELSDVREAYEFIGCKLSENKTIVSNSTTVFCGKFYWKGLDITPVRFLMTSLSDTNRFIGKLIARTRDFIDECNYSTRTKRTIFRKLKRILSTRYKGYLDFRLPHKLGGIQLDLGINTPLLPHLENNRNSLVCALCNIPYETEDFNSNHIYFQHLPLGKPYQIFGLCKTLSPGSWPKKSRLAYGARKRVIYELLSKNKAGISDVLSHLFDDTMLKT